MLTVEIRHFLSNRRRLLGCVVFLDASATDAMKRQIRRYLLCSCRSILLIAEVKSRFDRIGRFVKRLQKLGFSLVNKVCYKVEKS
jgi:Hypothetical methyltransferase